MHRSRLPRGGGDARGGPRLAGIAAVLCAAVLAASGCGAGGEQAVPDAPPSQAAETRRSAPDAQHRSVQRRDAAPDAAREAADPVRIRIPAIGVEAAIGPLTVDADRVLRTPEKPGNAGWRRAGPEPGEAGPAVVVGHLDSRTGPAVFYRLGDLRPGNAVLIDRADGSTAVFRVRQLEQHSQDDFPTERVYGSTPAPALRLITCGGDYDHEARNYLDNVIAFAELRAIR